jgi:predicted DNA-binding transcriptional regulator AlpA
MTRNSPHIERARAVRARLGNISNDTLYRLVRNKKLAPPIKLSERASGWLSTDVDRYLADCVALRDMGGAK